MFYDGRNGLLGGHGECVYSIAWIAEWRNYLGILFDFPLHCVLSFVGGFGDGHDRRRGNIAADSFFLSLLLHENHWKIYVICA